MLSDYSIDLDSRGKTAPSGPENRAAARKQRSRLNKRALFGDLGYKPHTLMSRSVDELRRVPQRSHYLIHATSQYQEVPQFGAVWAILRKVA